LSDYATFKAKIARKTIVLDVNVVDMNFNLIVISLYINAISVISVISVSVMSVTIVSIIEFNVSIANGRVPTNS
jgi:hypothetical protein